MNPNNPNTGGCTPEGITQHVPTKVSVTSPDHQPTVEHFTGKTFEPGSPAGREAQPKPKISGGDPILT